MKEVEKDAASHTMLNLSHTVSQFLNPMAQEVVRGVFMMKPSSYTAIASECSLELQGFLAWGRVVGNPPNLR